MLLLNDFVSTCSSGGIDSVSLILNHYITVTLNIIDLQLFFSVQTELQCTIIINPI